MILIGTACRGTQIDFDDGLMDLNPEGRTQTKNFRPVVKLPAALAAVLRNAPEGRLITYHGNSVKKICCRPVRRPPTSTCLSRLQFT